MYQTENVHFAEEHGLIRYLRHSTLWRETTAAMFSFKTPDA
jgi:hypothetical protein